MLRSRLLVAAALSAMAIAALPDAPALAQTTINCGQRCRLQLTPEPARSVDNRLSQWVQVTVTNTPFGAGMPMPLSFNPWQLKVVVNNPAATPIEALAPHSRDGTTFTALADAPIVLGPNMSRSFWVEIRRLPSGANRLEVWSNGAVLGGVPADFTEAFAILNPPAPPPPPPPPEAADVALAAPISAAFKGVWFTSDHYIRIMDGAPGLTRAILFDGYGVEMGRMEIDTARSTAAELALNMPGDSDGTISLYADGPQSVIAVYRAGGYDGSRGVVGVRAASIGTARPGQRTEAEMAGSLVGRWDTPFGVLTFSSDSGVLDGRIPATDQHQGFRFRSTGSTRAPKNQSLQFAWGEGSSVDGDRDGVFTLSHDGARFVATTTDYKIRGGQHDWWATRLPADASDPSPPSGGSGTSPSPGVPPVPATPTGGVGQWTAAAYQSWEGAWWFGGEYVTFRVQDGELKGEWLSAEAGHPRHTLLQIDLAKSNPNHLVGTATSLYRSGITDVGLRLAPDGQSAMMIGGDPARPFGGLLRRAAGVGQRPEVPTAAQVTERLLGSWETPAGRMQFTVNGGALDVRSYLGTFVTDPEERMMWRPGGTENPNALSDGLIDNINFDWRASRGSAPRVISKLRLVPSADGRAMTLIPVEGASIFGNGAVTLRRTGAPAEATRPLPPSDLQGTPPTPTEPRPVEPEMPDPISPSPPADPTPDPVPPVDPAPPQPIPPTLPQPEPPVTLPTPPQPAPPQPVPPQPTPPQPTPPQPIPPSSDGTSVGGQGGFQGISQTWDVQFEGARVEHGSEIHVFISVKNRSTSDQYVTPGTFIPNLSNQDGEVMTSRPVYRASGDAPTEFRPTVPVNEAVRVRFIFRPDPGSGQPRAFTLESFGHRKLTFDVSGLRVSSLAQ